MQGLIIEPFDTMFFRDGKPFSLGEESVGTSVFPPLPSVLHGALRSDWLGWNLNDLGKAGGQDDPTAKLRTQFIQLLFTEGDLRSPGFSFPRDFILTGGQPEALKLSDVSVEDGFRSATIKEGEKFVPKFILQATSRNKTESIESAFLSQVDFQSYLNGTLKSGKFFQLKDYITEEPKVGIGRNQNTGTTEEGNLYQIKMIRPEGAKGLRISFISWYKDLELPSENRLARVGGEGRPFSFLPVKKNDIANWIGTISNPVSNTNENVFKIYFASPAIFNEGWYPGSLLEEHGLELLTCAIGKPLSAGGWDIAKRKPKPMYKCIPAGSVFYVKAKDADAAKKASKSIHMSNQSDYRSEEGFGFCFCGLPQQEN